MARLGYQPLVHDRAAVNAHFRSEAAKQLFEEQTAFSVLSDRRHERNWSSPAHTGLPGVQLWPDMDSESSQPRKRRKSEAGRPIPSWQVSVTDLLPLQPGYAGHYPYPATSSAITLPPSPAAFKPVAGHGSPSLTSAPALAPAAPASFAAPAFVQPAFISPAALSPPMETMKPPPPVPAHRIRARRTSASSATSSRDSTPPANKANAPLAGGTIAGVGCTYRPPGTSPTPYPHPLTSCEACYNDFRRRASTGGIPMDSGLQQRRNSVDVKPKVDIMPTVEESSARPRRREDSLVVPYSKWREGGVERPSTEVLPQFAQAEFNFSVTPAMLQEAYAQEFARLLPVATQRQFRAPSLTFAC